jgi:hypothetical protein
MAPSANGWRRLVLRVQGQRSGSHTDPTHLHIVGPYMPLQLGHLVNCVHNPLQYRVTSFRPMCLLYMKHPIRLLATSFKGSSSERSRSEFVHREQEADYEGVNLSLNDPVMRDRL